MPATVLVLPVLVVPTAAARRLLWPAAGCCSQVGIRQGNRRCTATEVKGGPKLGPRPGDPDQKDPYQGDPDHGDDQGDPDQVIRLVWVPRVWVPLAWVPLAWVPP